MHIHQNLIFASSNGPSPCSISSRLHFPSTSRILPLYIKPVLDNCTDFSETFTFFFSALDITADSLENNTSRISAVIRHMKYNVVFSTEIRLDQWCPSGIFLRKQKQLHFLLFHKLLILFFFTMHQAVPSLKMIPLPAVRQVIYHIFSAKMSNNHIGKTIFFLQL